MAQTGVGSRLSFNMATQGAARDATHTDLHNFSIQAQAKNLLKKHRQLLIDVQGISTID